MDQSSQGGFRYHHRIYTGLLLFVVVAGLPIVAVPSLRHRLQERVETLRSAWAGKPLIRPALATVGANPAPFPKEFERPQWTRPDILPKMEAPARPAVLITAGGDAPSKPEKPTPERVRPELKIPQARADAEVTVAEKAPEQALEARKGKVEQDAFDILVAANQILAGLVAGRDPKLKFQDWSATSMGQDSYNVSVTFVESADNVVRRYIWNVKVESKAVMPLSAYAREISK